MFESGVAFGERVALLRRGGSAPTVPGRVLLPGDGTSVRDRAASARFRPVTGPGRAGRRRDGVPSSTGSMRPELAVPGRPGRSERVRREFGVPDRSEADAATADRLGWGPTGGVRDAEVLIDWGYWTDRVRYLADHAPGAELAGLLEHRPEVCDAPFGAGLPSGTGSLRAQLRLDSMAVRHRLICALQGEQFADASELAREYPANQEFLACEVALALGVSESSAGTVLSTAFTLASKLPGTLDALRAGRITGEIAAVMVGATAVVTDLQLAAQIENEVLPTVRCRSRESVRRSVCREVIRLDPDGADRRHREARSARSISRWGDVDGMGWLKIHAPIQDLAPVWEALTGLAGAARTPGGDRTLDQRRTDVFTDIFHAILDHGGWDELLLPEQHGRKAHVQVLIPHDVLFGAGARAAATQTGAAAGAPSESAGARAESAGARAESAGASAASRGVCEVVGFGPVAPSQGLRIAVDGVWQRLVCDPLSGTLLDLGRTRYIPPDSLKDFVIARDQECPMVGCSVTARRGQIDHAVPFSKGGRTCSDNMTPPCTHHHRSKDGGGWKLVINADLSKTWTTPLGRQATNPAVQLIPPRTPLDGATDPPAPGQSAPPF